MYIDEVERTPITFFQFKKTGTHTIKDNLQRKMQQVLTDYLMNVEV